MRMKKFNTTGLCNPNRHYMVDISERLRAIKGMVDEGDYFCINRPRQYGKTTTLSALRKYLSDQYEVISLSFQKIGQAGFASEGAFVWNLARLFLASSEFGGVSIPQQQREALQALCQRNMNDVQMNEITWIILRWCNTAQKRLVLIIDEVDSATNNQVFLDFLAQLRDMYLEREANDTPAFHSVILAGVTDVRHLKAKIRPDEAHKENSPWNIAAEFNLDMSLSADGICGMLDEYENDRHTGMDMAGMAKLLRSYTSGYPYLVSRLCQLMDGQVCAQMGSLSAAWTGQGLNEAIKIILADRTDLLFSSLMGKLKNIPELKTQLRSVLMQGSVIPWKADDTEQELLWMYGFIVNRQNTVKIANRLFEMRLYQYFLGESNQNDAFQKDALAHRSIFINEDHTLNMPLILDHFVKAQRIIHRGEEERFLEEEGRERFLTYLSPIINGTGTFSVEEQTRDQRRMEVVIHYLGQRYVVELKIWHGQRYNTEGEKQIMGYLDFFGLSTGYMVSFNFNQKKTSGMQRLTFGDKVLFEATV